MEGLDEAINNFVGEVKELRDLYRSVHVEDRGNYATFTPNATIPDPYEPEAYIQRVLNQFTQLKKELANRGILMEFEYEEHPALIVEGRVVPLVDNAEYHSKYVYLFKGPVEVLNEIQRHV